MAINKEKSINYMLGLIVFCIALAIINKFAFNFWKFDIFNPKHYIYFAKYMLSGKILHSPKYISFLIVLCGTVTISYFAISESLKFDFSKYFQNNEKNTEKQPEPKKATSTEKQSSPAREEEITPAQPQQDERITRYNIYNNPERVQDTTIINETIPQQRPAPQPEPKEDVNNSIDEEMEREKLQSKIKEVMERLKNKNNDTEVKEDKPSVEQKILTPMQFDNAKSNTEMNFKNISTEQNNMMEGILVGAGFKLLSEIRIGQTGIDYLGVSKDGISIIQLDTTNGNWMASEDDVGNIMPVWFSEDKQKISPVARAIEAREAIKNLIKDKVNLPVKAYACLANSSVINYFDISDKWDEAGIDVLRLPSNTTIDDIDTLDKKFQIGSQKEIDETTMDNLIEILEKAELPE